MVAAPLMAETPRSTAGGTSSWRKTIASTKASGPEASTRLAYAAASTPTSRATARADAPALAGPTLERSMPMRTTGRSVTSARPPAPRMSPRSAPRLTRSRVTDSCSEGSMVATSQSTCHSSSSKESGASVW